MNRVASRHSTFGLSSPVAGRGALSKLLLLLLAFLPAADSFASHPPDNTECQYWNEFVFEHEFAPRWSMELSLEQNLFDDFKEFGMWNVQVRPFYDVGGPLSLGLEYRCERERDDGRWVTEHRYGILPVLSRKWGDWKFKLMSRLEYRDQEDGHDWRWREKLKIAKPCRIASFEFTPWVSEEPFYSFNADRVNQNRATVGLSKELPSGIEATLYYLNRVDKEDDGWLTTHVVGTEFGVKW